MARYRPTTVARFWSKVDVRDNDIECWEWKASKNAGGYGRFKANGTTQNASRIAWEIAHDAPLWGKVARHTCDNPACCNPAHIIPGDQADNIADKMQRGGIGTACCAARRTRGRN